jgi:hypothetical protein
VNDDDKAKSLNKVTREIHALWNVEGIMPGQQTTRTETNLMATEILRLRRALTYIDDICMSGSNDLRGLVAEVRHSCTVALSVEEPRVSKTELP